LEYREESGEGGHVLEEEGGSTTTVTAKKRFPVLCKYLKGEYCIKPEDGGEGGKGI